MSEDSVQVWLVERDYTDKGLVTIVYATPDGERKLVEQRSANRVRDVTAATEASPENLQKAADDERERFRTEVERVRERHDPDDHI